MKHTTMELLNPSYNCTARNIMWQAVPRGFALFLGVFSALNLLERFRSAPLDENLWWIDLRWFPPALATVVLVFSALCLLAFAVRPPKSAWQRSMTIACSGGLTVVCLLNSVQFYVLAARGRIHLGLPVPLSLFIGAALGIILLAATRAKSPRLAIGGSFVTVLSVCFLCVILFSFAQMFCFGKTDYRRPADVAVVLGARVYANGRPSDALADRIRTACELYRDGLVGKLLVSGGPGDGTIHETEAMKRMAMRLGVKEQDILVDSGGLNTQATVKHSQAILSQVNASRVLVVSHFYHLPRIKMAYQRAGRDVYTVPARESYFLRQMPLFLAREVAAFWVYYVRGLAG